MTPQQESEQEARIIENNDTRNNNRQESHIPSAVPLFQRQEMRQHRPSFSERRDFFHFISTVVTIPSESSCNARLNHRKEPANCRRNRVNPDPSNVDANGRWEWIIETARPVPDYWKLERNSLHLAEENISAISRRISHFLRINSVSAQYYDDYVECSTSGFLKFVVYLWKNDNEIIVEVQRRRGSCLHMKKIRNCLYQAIESPQMLVVHQDNHVNQVPETVIRSCADGKQKQEGGCKATLKCAERLLSSNCLDEVQLGMETMLSIVDLSTTTDASLSLRISKSIVCGTEGRCTAKIRSFLGEYFYNIERDNTAFVDDDEANYARGRHFGKMHTMALEILANALKNVQQEKANGDTMVDVDIKSWFWRNIINALIYNVSEVPYHRMQEASLSAMCLDLLLQLEPHYRYWLEDRLIGGLVNAHQCGQRYHCELERKAELLMNRLSRQQSS